MMPGMRAALLCALLAGPSAADTSPAQEAHAKAREAHEDAAAAMAEGRGLLKDLAALQGRYRADADFAALSAEREALRARTSGAQRRYQLSRRELLELRKEHQSGQLLRLLAVPEKDQFAAGLMESLEFDRLLADLSGFGRDVERALADDEAAYAAALLEARHARRLRAVLWAAGALALTALLYAATRPARWRVRLPPPDAPRLE
jgi:hypothetical protein